MKEKKSPPPPPHLFLSFSLSNQTYVGGCARLPPPPAVELGENDGAIINSASDPSGPRLHHHTDTCFQNKSNTNPPAHLRKLPGGRCLVLMGAALFFSSNNKKQEKLPPTQGPSDN